LHAIYKLKFESVFLFWEKEQNIKRKQQTNKVRMASVDPTSALRVLSPDELSSDEKELQGVFASAPIAKLFGMRMDFNRYD